MSKKNLVEETVASVRQAKADAVSKAEAKPETKTAPAPKARRRSKPVVSMNHGFGLLFKGSLKLKRTFSTSEEALEYVKSMPLGWANEVRLAVLHDLKVETKVEIQPNIGNLLAPCLNPSHAAIAELSEEGEDDLDSEPEEAE